MKIILLELKHDLSRILIQLHILCEASLQCFNMGLNTNVDGSKQKYHRDGRLKFYFTHILLCMYIKMSTKICVKISVSILRYMKNS